MVNYKNNKLVVSVITASVLIILIQFIDSYCTEIFGRTQSLSVTTFLVDMRGMSADDGVAYMSRMMLPFYFIGMLTPFVRSYADIVGRKVMLFINVALLVAGSAICLTADSLMIYLLGNGILILGYSLDIHMIYIVDMLPENRRATVRGICGGVSMAAAMCIPLMRSLLVGSAGHSWQEIYLVGAAGGICILLFLGVCMAVQMTTGREKKKERCNARLETHETNDSKIHFILTFKDFCKQNKTRSLLISICAVGLATAGVQYYNEPLLAFGGMGEKNVNLVLLWQPVTAMAINIITGILADRVKREYVVAAGMVISLVAGVSYICGAGYIDSPVVMGILWGCMSGFYYSSEELINMMVMESAAPEVRGRASAISTFAYGIGDQAGIFAISLIVGAAGMRWTKLLFLGVPLSIALILIRRNLIRTDR